MYNIFKTFLKKKKSIIYTQDELDNKLFDSIYSHNYKLFCEMIKLGANINIVKTLPSLIYYYFDMSPLQCIIYNWKGSNKKQYKFLKVLFESNANLSGTMYNNYPVMLYEFDAYETIIGKINSKYKENILNCLIKNYPNYMKEKKLKEDINKYNL